MARPIARYVYREKESGQYFECGLMWTSQKEGYNPNFAPHKKGESSPDGTSEKISFIDALGRVNKGEGFINISTDKEAGILGLISSSPEDTDDF